MSLFEISAAVDDAVLCVGAEVKQLLLIFQNRSLSWVSFAG